MGVARPTVGQRDYYSGYKHHHGIKFQALMTPDGLCVSLSGPYIGEINDNLMVAESGIINRLDTVDLPSVFFSIFTPFFCLFILLTNFRFLPVAVARITYTATASTTRRTGSLKATLRQTAATPPSTTRCRRCGSGSSTGSD